MVADLRWDGADDAAALARRHMARQLRADEALERHAAQLVEQLFSMPVAKELAAARERLAEMEFLLSWPPMPTGGAVGEGIRLPQSSPRCGPILHGFIDCLFADVDGDWHIVDYKTNRVTPEEVPAAAAGYEMQLLLYALAAEQTLGKPPKSLRLCFVVPGVEHRFRWDEAHRERAINLVASALDETITRQSNA
jgi:ATP-dependent exoDNAse (exonuclease V) beta subunit